MTSAQDTFHCQSRREEEEEGGAPSVHSDETYDGQRRRRTGGLVFVRVSRTFTETSTRRDDRLGGGTTVKKPAWPAVASTRPLSPPSRAPGPLKPTRSLKIFCRTSPACVRFIRNSLGPASLGEETLLLPRFRWRRRRRSRGWMRRNRPLRRAPALPIQPFDFNSAPLSLRSVAVTTENLSLFVCCVYKTHAISFRC